MKMLIYENSRQRRFLAGYILVGLGLFLLMYLNQQNLISRPVNSFTAHSVKELAELFNFPSTVEQRIYIRERGMAKIYVPTTLLTVGNYTARVILECSAVHISILLITFLLAYPAPVAQKIQGIALLVPCLIFFNTMRIFLLMLLGHYFGQNSVAFNIFHVYIMQVLIIALVLILALFWLRRVELRKIDTPFWYLLKFLAISATLTFVWVFLRNTFELNAGIVESALFPVLTFLSLVLASYRLNIRGDYKEILLGLGIMLGFVLLVQCARLAYLHFHSGPSELFFVMTNSAYRYLLPFGLFLFFIRKKLFIRANHSGRLLSACPPCEKKDDSNI